MSKKRKKGLSLASKIARQSAYLLHNNQKRSSGVYKSKGKTLTKNKTTGAQIISGIRYLPAEESIKNLRNIISSKASRNAGFSCIFPSSVEIKDSVKYSVSEHGLGFDLTFEAIILSSFGSEIETFIMLKSKFDAFLLNSELEKAKKILSEIFKKFGYSNWYVSSELNILYEEGGTKSILEYDTKVTNLFKVNKYNNLSAVFMKYPFIRCDKGVSYDRYSFSIQHQSEEFVLSKDKSNIEQINFAHLFSPEHKYNYLS